MALDQSVLSELLDAFRTGEGLDLIKEAAALVCQELIEVDLTGFFSAVGRDPLRSYNEILTRMSVGLGDDALATARSLSTARRRAVRANRTEAASAR